ncbi:MAG TPA: AcvB/VirJ family lysyl-phosphatidylglycerol hydrolase, partial [Candidatus Polarisedimenticolia bacterium]|nr:AcvB/VirJ family lysyl-phosphatidylglycerol hydrolase [Candidatus Polarisedimenticolia bacterium]
RRSVLPPRPDLAPRADHAARWTALQGTVDRVCDPGAVSRFGAQIPAARVVSLPKVGHGFSVTRNWGEAYDAAIEALLEKAGMFEPIGGADLRAKLAQSPEEIRRRVEPLDLPLEILWPEGAHDAVIFISGDGGWAELDQQIAAALAARGVAVVGWNTLRYFWTARTPASFRADLGRLVGALPADVRLFLGGYSFGAEVAPVALEKTSLGESEGLDGLSRIAGLVLLAPGPYATFEVSPLDWVRTDETPTSHPVREAIEAGRGRPVLCIESAGTDDSGCPRTPVPGLTREVQPGGHHFAGDFNQIAARILEFIGAVPDAAR